MISFSPRAQANRFALIRRLPLRLRSGLRLTGMTEGRFVAIDGRGADSNVIKAVCAERELESVACVKYPKKVFKLPRIGQRGRN